jgi:deoxyribose-phosphate aldolase
MSESLFSRELSSWRVGEAAPPVFKGKEILRSYSIPLAFGWAVFSHGQYRGESERPQGEIVTANGSVFSGSKILESVDATLLRAELDPGELDDFLLKAKVFRAKNVCLFPRDIKNALAYFPAPATVISFPHGAETKEMKRQAIEIAEKIGAREFDVVCDLSLFRAKDWEGLLQEFHYLRHSTEGVIKIIIETSLHEVDDIRTATEIARDAGIDYIKTSTGKNGRGASISDVKAMSSVSEIKVKASGGIRSKEEANNLLKAGADIIGASNLLPFL